MKKIISKLNKKKKMWKWYSKERKGIVFPQ